MSSPSFFDQALAQFMLISPVILPAAGVHFTTLGVACRAPWTGNGRVEGFPVYTIEFYLTDDSIYLMTESKRRSNIKKIQARQCRYHAMGRCWCGRELRAGYKRCENCIARMTERREKYQSRGLCYCGTPVISGTKRNGAPYKTCQRCLDRAKARYQPRKDC